MILPTARHILLKARSPIALQLSKRMALPSFGNHFSLLVFGDGLHFKECPQGYFSTLAANSAMSSQEAISEKLTNLTVNAKGLDDLVVAEIKRELLEVDANSDQRLDASELKKLLRKHTSAFTDAEILQIGELFYAGNAGGSISFDRFIQAVNYIAAKNAVQDMEKQLQRDQKNHPLEIGDCGLEYLHTGRDHHGNYTEEQLDIKLTHVKPETTLDTLALNAVKMMRFLFDSATGWRSDNISRRNILNRVIFLETIAAVPGMVAAIVRHFKSLRAMTRDGGMLQMFLEEANNERMHLLTFVKMKDPSTLFRAAVIGSQFGFGSLFLLAYMISPKFCHRFVGYVEEEACDTYTKIIKAIEVAPHGSELAEWKTQRAPKIAISYWKLGENGSVLDLMRAVRADEAEHRDVNHTVSSMTDGQSNPMCDPQEKLDLALLKYVNDLMNRDGRLSKY